MCSLGKILPGAVENAEVPFIHVRVWGSAILGSHPETDMHCFVSQSINNIFFLATEQGFGQCMSP